ncbi:hypothetical protein, partial [Streptomyces lavendulae]|uniref:hypothetical protein n=1 Tax=Streptomyces lavendulae TaxID=1914 RepID=UPI002553F68E
MGDENSEHLALIRRWLAGETVNNTVGIKIVGGPFVGVRTESPSTVRMNVPSSVAGIVAVRGCVHGDPQRFRPLAAP